MSLELRIAFSDGLPSLLINPPGIFPAAYIFSSNSQESGKKSISARGLVDAVAVTVTTVSP
jgi:hypothetical protein